MKEKFSDIFESIDGLHKKFNSKEYLNRMEHFSDDSRDLVEILEKYKINNTNNIIKPTQKNIKKMSYRPIKRG